MIDEAIYTMINTVGFPIAIALILLYDKLKTNGSLLKVVENNSSILKRIENRLCKEVRKNG